MGKAIAPIVGEQAIGLFEGSYSQNTLHQADSEDFGIGKVGLSMMGAPPMGSVGILLEKIGDEDIDWGEGID